MSKDQRFHIVAGARLYTLLDRGRAIHRDFREDSLQQFASDLVDQEKSAKIAGNEV